MAVEQDIGGGFVMDDDKMEKETGSRIQNPEP